MKRSILITAFSLFSGVALAQSAGSMDTTQGTSGSPQGTQQPSDQQQPSNTQQPGQPSQAPNDTMGSQGSSTSTETNQLEKKTKKEKEQHSGSSKDQNY